VYFNQDPVLSVAAGGGFGGGFGGGRGGGFGGAPDTAIPGVGMNVTPMAGASQAAAAVGLRSGGHAARCESWSASAPGEVGAVQQGLAGGGRGGQGGVVDAAASLRRRWLFAGCAAGCAAVSGGPNDMLLSGTLAGGQALANRAQLVDIPLGQGTWCRSRFVRSGGGRRREPTSWRQRHPQLERSGRGPGGRRATRVDGGKSGR